MKSDLRNYAYIDGNNLHRGIKELGWKLDYFRFRRWLIEKYQITKAYIFLGYVPSNRRLYEKLRHAGFILVFKSLSYQSDGNYKGNCDAELVLQAVADYYENKFDQAILISSDGDFACLIVFLLKKKALKTVIAPNSQRCSYLIRRAFATAVFLNNYRQKLALNEKAPGTDGTAQGTFS